MALQQYIDQDTLEDMTITTERHIKRYSKIRELYSRLIIFGGSYFYIDPSDSAHWIDRLLQDGEYIYPDRVSYAISKQCHFKPLMCYQNLLRAYPAGFSKRELKIYIGYSLMVPESLWLQHVWMYNGRTIYESTPVKSSKYFGIPTTLGELKSWMEDYRWGLPPNPDLDL